MVHILLLSPQSPFIALFNLKIITHLRKQPPSEKQPKNQLTGRLPCGVMADKWEKSARANCSVATPVSGLNELLGVACWHCVRFFMQGCVVILTARQNVIQTALYKASE